MSFNKNTRRTGFAIIALLALFAGTAYPHGSAIDVLVDADGQLYPFTFASGIPLGDPPEFNYFVISDSIISSSPGFGIVNSANGVAANTRIDLNVAQSLQYWNGTGLTVPADAITIRSPDGIGTYTVDALSGPQTGMRWGLYPGGTFWDEHGVYVLSPNEATAGVYGIWMELASPSYETSDPFLVPFLYDPNDEFTFAQVNTAIEAMLNAEVDPPLVGDFNADTFINVEDIDLLSAAVRDGNNPTEFDLTGDGLVNSDDRVFWVDEIVNTFFGDANFDSEFGSSDLVAALQSGTYEDNIPGNSGWADGDWDGDGDFGTSDLLVAFQSGAYEQGPRASVAAVPEPAAALIAWLGIMPVLYAARKKSK